MLMGAGVSIESHRSPASTTGIYRVSDLSLNISLVGWLVGCFGFNGPLRQYFSLYRAVSQREGERGERIDESKNVQTTPTRTYCKRNRPLPYSNQNKQDAPALEVYPAPSHHPTTPITGWRSVVKWIYHEREAQVLYSFTTDRQPLIYWTTNHLLARQDKTDFDSNTQEARKRQMYPSDGSSFPPLREKKSRQEL